MGESLSSRIIIARPELVDPSFARSVVYLLEHDAEGAVGVIINRPSGVPVRDHLPAVAELIGDSEFAEGGPVASTSVLALASPGGAAPRLVDLDELTTGAHDPQRIRFFVGYAGWSAAQLDREIAEDSWIIARRPGGDGGHASDVFDPRPDGLWRALLRRERPPISLLAMYPDDLSSN